MKLEFLNKLKLKRVPEDLVAVDLSGSQIKILHAKNASPGKVTVEGVLWKKLNQSTEADIVPEVLGYFQQNHIKASQVVCVIPAKLFISKNVEIPSTEKEEIAKIIDLQAGRFTPYSRDEIVIDFFCMDTPTQHYTSVLLVIVNRNLIDRYCRVFEDMGIPIKIAIAPEALVQTYREVLKPSSPDDFAIGGLCIGEDATDFSVMDHNQMVFVRSLPVGSEHFAASKQLAVSEFINELNKSLAVYQDQGVGKPLKTLVITGLVAEGEALKEEILKNCPVLQRADTVIKILDSRTYYPLSEAAFEQMKALSHISFFELAAGLAHAPQTQIDLIPKEIKLKRRFREESKEITNLGITIMTIFVVLSLFFYTKIYFKNIRMEKIMEAGKSSFEEARTLERISTKNRVVRKILKNRGKGLSAFDNLTGQLGETIYLSHFTYDMEGKLELGGTADSMSQVFALVTRLEESNYYRHVAAKETKSRKEGDRDVADFEIEAILPEGPAAEKWAADEAEKAKGGAPKEAKQEEKK